LMLHQEDVLKLERCVSDKVKGAQGA